MNLPIDQIKYSGLSKYEPEIIARIKKSIVDNGMLFHPILVDEKHRLIAGGKRLRCCIELGWTEIPVEISSSLLSREEVTLHENIYRYNLPWYEQVKAEKDLHDLRISQHGKKAKGCIPRISGKNQGWSQADTARELGIAVSTLSQDINLAEALLLNPNLKKVKDKMTAMKLVKQTARRMEAEVEALIPSDFEMDQILLGNSLDILQNLPPNIFDACITDPPWLVYARDEELTADCDTLPVFKEVFRVLKPNSFLYMVVSTPDFILYSKELPKFGFQIQQYPLIWKKAGTMTHGKKPWQYARDFEPILLAVKGSPILTESTELSSIFDYPSMHYTKMIHPHEKPVEFVRAMVKHSTFPGAKILEPFGGSGVLAEACASLGRSYFVIERDQTFYNNIVKRMENYNATGKHPEQAVALADGSSICSEISAE
jgi:DNA modification methylase/ParB-like chromosome segregation protein Spo0J